MADTTDPTGSKEGGPEALFRDVPVALHVSVGRARIPVGELLALERNAVVALDRSVDDPVSLHAGDRVIAYGELQELEGDPEGRLAVRITEILDGESED